MTTGTRSLRIVGPRLLIKGKGRQLEGMGARICIGTIVGVAICTPDRIGTDGDPAGIVHRNQIVLVIEIANKSVRHQKMAIFTGIVWATDTVMT